MGLVNSAIGSGLPTFRSAQHAFWADYDAQKLATPVARAQDPARVWAWYEWRRAMVMQAQPNAAHHGTRAVGTRPTGYGGNSKRGGPARTFRL